jgi:hypothetical protein
MRRHEARVVAAALAALEADLGGAVELSAMEQLILAGIGRRLRDLHKIESYIDGLSSIANRRSRAVFPIVETKHKILDGLHRDLERLGLKRRTKELTIRSWLAGANENGTQSHAEPATATQTPEQDTGYSRSPRDTETGKWLPKPDNGADTDGADT